MNILKQKINDLWTIAFTHKAKLSLTAFCVLVAIFDTFFQSLSTISAVALAIAVMPWAIQFIERISAPGGFELVFKQAEKTLDDQNANPNEADYQAFKDLRTNDPNLALAALRIEIEKRLRTIAGHRLKQPQKLFVKPQSINSLLRALVSENVVDHSIASLISDMLPTLNSAVHGAYFPPDTAGWVLENGPRLLAILDEKH